MAERQSSWIGEKCLRTFGVSALATLLQIANVSADALPRELVLQCQGDARLSITRDNKTESQKDSFHLVLRLKDGSLSDVDYNFLEGKNCALADGIIRCELDTTTYNRELDTTNEEHRTAAINRATGEMHLLLDSQSFAGANAVGKPEATIKSSRTGVCRTAANGPLF